MIWMIKRIRKLLRSTITPPNMVTIGEKASKIDIDLKVLLNASTAVKHAKTRPV